MDTEALEHKFLFQNGMINNLKAENEALESEIQVLSKENIDYEVIFKNMIYLMIIMII
jgi:hypothetical protein